MNAITAKEAQTRFGQLLDRAQREDVAITRREREVAVVISREKYDEMRADSDRYWVERAKKAAESGYASPEETRQFFARIVANAQDDELTELYRRLISAPDKDDNRRTQEPGQTTT